MLTSARWLLIMQHLLYRKGKQEENWNQLPRSGWKVMSTKPLTIDLQKKVTINAFTYAPLKAEAKPTMAFRYKFYISLDGKSWKEVPTNGEFSNIMHNPLPQTVYFNQKSSGTLYQTGSHHSPLTAAEVEPNEIGVTIAP